MFIISCRANLNFWYWQFFYNININYLVRIIVLQCYVIAYRLVISCQDQLKADNVLVR